MVVVSNARYFGGSFLIAPGADLEDGKLDLVAIGNAGAARRAKLFGMVAKGRHEAEQEVRVRTGASLTIDADGEITYEMDGEVFTARGPLEITTVPRALELVVPPVEARDAA
jgi:diacylglycerol kinase (ATP)